MAKYEEPYAEGKPIKDLSGGWASAIGKGITGFTEAKKEKEEEGKGSALSRRDLDANLSALRKVKNPNKSYE